MYIGHKRLIMNEILLKFKRDPIGFLRRAFYKTLVAPLRYRRKGGYDARRYWQDRLDKYGTSLKGVGDEGLSEKDNKVMYEQAALKFLELCRKEGVDLKQSRVLEIGCGNGFYTQILWDQGVKQYVGIDIADSLFPGLVNRFPGYTFSRRDVTADAIKGKFDVILMIDVIEHIVGDAALDHAMKAVQDALVGGGIFLVAPLARIGKKSLFYVRFWTAADITKRLASFQFGDLVPFRYSHLLAARKLSSAGEKTDQDSSAGQPGP